MSLETKPDSLIIKWQWLDWNMDSKFQMLMKSRALKCQDWIWNLKALDKQNCYQWIKNSKALNGIL